MPTASAVKIPAKPAMYATIIISYHLHKTQGFSYKNLSFFSHFKSSL